ncbi:DNA mismatch repair protein MutS [Ferruginibacter paludis]|uniref:MutS-related protein n=1 Tax=Ferruginibacter paludis TaxID=1310417 RepID=UPI0025B5810E|nr:DNA mismatch repair protein MutS [Ferruginibacter paludis]MDN3656084.1 DNA mismatch repair protein MutS [Ferruginibacter paludis]
MEIDKTSLNDLAIFNGYEDFSVFNKLNNTLTTNGKEQLRKNLATPLSSTQAINNVQQTLKFIMQGVGQWPIVISNGTIMVVERFYEYSLDPLPNNISFLTAKSYKLFHNADYTLIQYSIIHCFDFIKGMMYFVDTYLNENTPANLRKLLETAARILGAEELNVVQEFAKPDELTVPQQLQFGQFLRYHFKQNIFTLIDIHAQLDALYGMAVSINKYQFVFPEFIESDHSLVAVEGLYHILLQKPVPYDVLMNPQSNFLFLTGANMAGKSTFIKSVGIAIFLAHVGMGVPAKNMKLTLIDGMLSNINVIDNISKGESYFYNEVQRIKATIDKIRDGRKWLILIDELFKGTNIQDAMKCSTVVIEGLLKITNSLFILSTHLYEIGENLKLFPNISFNYFETIINDGQFSFNYQLRNGISTDRLGYLILEREGVVKMLETL